MVRLSTHAQPPMKAFSSLFPHDISSTPGYLGTRDLIEESDLARKRYGTDFILLYRPTSSLEESQKNKNEGVKSTRAQAEEPGASEDVIARCKLLNPNDTGSFGHDSREIYTYPLDPEDFDTVKQNANFFAASPQSVYVFNERLRCDSLRYSEGLTKYFNDCLPWKDFLVRTSQCGEGQYLNRSGVPRDPVDTAEGAYHPYLTESTSPLHDYFSPHVVIEADHIPPSLVVSHSTVASILEGNSNKSSKAGGIRNSHTGWSAALRKWRS